MYKQLIGAQATQAGSTFSTADLANGGNNAANQLYWSYVAAQATTPGTLEFTINRVANGYVVKTNGQDYVFTDEATLCLWLSERLAAKAK